MKKPLDLFSEQAHQYKVYRPSYPDQLYTDILSITHGRHACWDCATGNGQVAEELAKHFVQVYATDVSQQQLDQAPRKSNISYSTERAEETSFADNAFDLITVGQALHWFDHEAFNTEVKRLLQPSGIIAVWCYGVLRIHAEIDAIIDEFYRDIVGPYWAPERDHVDRNYADIPFHFSEVQTQHYEFVQSWTRHQLAGYLNTWSSVQKYKQIHTGSHPVKWVTDRIEPLLEDEEVLQVRFPIFLQTGRKQ